MDHRRCKRLYSRRMSLLYASSLANRAMTAWVQFHADRAQVQAAVKGARDKAAGRVLRRWSRAAQRGWEVRNKVGPVVQQWVKGGERQHASTMQVVVQVVVQVVAMLLIQ